MSCTFEPYRLFTNSSNFLGNGSESGPKGRLTRGNTQSAREFVAGFGSPTSEQVPVRDFGHRTGNRSRKGNPHSRVPTLGVEAEEIFHKPPGRFGCSTTLMPGTCVSSNNNRWRSSSRTRRSASSSHGMGPWWTRPPIAVAATIQYVAFTAAAAASTMASNSNTAVQSCSCMARYGKDAHARSKRLRHGFTALKHPGERDVCSTA
mmetsp:Transcript_34434/g.82151  ORF Transcript_34434/g.82151 Transcript_34434/m.82151 type:complete len:205 (-) Transcript_34434:2161-2775(-)